MKCSFFFLCLILPLVAREVPQAADTVPPVVKEKPAPLECRIRAAHVGGGGVVTLKISLENVGKPPLRVMRPNYWYDMSAGTMIGGWSFQFIGPDGEPAKIDWGGPPPSPKALMPKKDGTVVLAHGEFIGMSLPLKGQLGDVEKVSRLVVTYWVQENYLEKYLLKNNEWITGLRPALWEGKVMSQTFDIARFVETRPKKVDNRSTKK